MAEEIAKGLDTSEVSEASSNNDAGVYRHPKAKKEIITVPGEKGKIQADALVRLGFVRVGNVPSRVELDKMRADQLHKDRVLEAQEKANIKAAEEAADAEVAKALGK
jgi:hypothetical protein